MSKILYIIADGMGDLPIEQLNRKTPLAYAYKPNIDHLLSNAACAFPSVLGRLAPQSDAGVLADLGYDPTKYSTGRGWFECLGLGMAPEDGDLSVRVNFGEVENGTLKSVRTYMSKEELRQLEDEINEKVKLPVDFDFKAGEGYRAGLVLRKGGTKFSQYVSNNEPGYEPKFYRGGKKLSFASKITSKKISKISAIKNEAKNTAGLLNSFIEKAVDVVRKSECYSRRKAAGSQLPNYVFLRDAAVGDPKLPPINSRYGHGWTAVAGMPLEKGIAKAAGMSLVETSELEDVNEDLKNKADKLAVAMSRSDAVYLHIKQTDSASHLGKYADKYAIIEAIDRIIFSRAIRLVNIGRGDTIVFTCDHATSCEQMRHINSNIPVLIVNRRFGRISDFSERACSRSPLRGIKKAIDIMPFVTGL